MEVYYILHVTYCSLTANRLVQEKQTLCTFCRFYFKFAHESFEQMAQEVALNMICNPLKTMDNDNEVRLVRWHGENKS